MYLKLMIYMVILLPATMIFVIYLVEGPSGLPKVNSRPMFVSLKLVFKLWAFLALAIGIWYLLN